MAFICNEPKGACDVCSEYRWDEDKQAMCCFAAASEKAKRKARINTVKKIKTDLEEWIGFVKSVGNEDAYTDSILLQSGRRLTAIYDEEPF